MLYSSWFDFSCIVMGCINFLTLLWSLESIYNVWNDE